MRRVHLAKTVSGRENFSRRNLGAGAGTVKFRGRPQVRDRHFHHSRIVKGHHCRALGWATSLAIFAIALMLHARAVSGVVLPTDLHSPGWGGLLGPSFAFRCLATATAAIALPAIPAALLFTTSIFGLASTRADWGVCATLMVVGYVALLTLLARAGTLLLGDDGRAAVACRARLRAPRHA